MIQYARLPIQLDLRPIYRGDALAVGGVAGILGYDGASTNPVAGIGWVKAGASSGTSVAALPSTFYSGATVQTAAPGLVLMRCEAP